MNNYIFCTSNFDCKKPEMFCFHKCSKRFKCPTIKPEMDRIYDEIKGRWEKLGEEE